MKLIYKEHLGTNKMWSLYTGGLYIQLINMESISLGICRMVFS